jgi:hypothetical protein
MGFDAGRDAGVAGQRPAPRSALKPEPSRAAKKWDFEEKKSNGKRQKAKVKNHRRGACVVNWQP